MRRSWILALALAALTGCPGPTPPAPAEQTRTGPRPRIVTAAPALAELVCAVGAEPNLVGVSSYCVYPPSLRQLPQIGGAIDPNLEAIDSLAPDLVLLQTKDERLEELAARRTLQLVHFRIETVADVRSAARTVGDLVGKPDGVAAVVARLDAALDAAREAAPSPPVRCLVVFGRQAGDLSQLSAPGAATFIADCVAAAGGAPVLADLRGDAWHVISPEAVVERAPELIIELHTDPIDAAKAAALRADWAALPSVPAVKSGRIAIVQGDEALIPGPRLALLVEKLSRAVRGENDVGGSPP